MTESTHSAMPVTHLLFSFQRQSLELLTRMAREPIDLMLQMPRPTSHPMAHATQEIMQHSLTANKRLVEAMAPVVDIWMNFPLTCLDIMSNAIREPIDAAIVQFRQKTEDFQYTA